MVKILPAMWEVQVPFLGQEYSLEKGMATHSSILAWRIPWTEEPGGLQSVGSQRVGRDWATRFTTQSASAIHQDPLWSQYRPRGVCPIPSLQVLLSMLSLSGCHSVQCRGKIGTAQLPRPVSQSIPGPPGAPSSIRGYPIFQQDAQWGLDTFLWHQQRSPRGAPRPASLCRLLT